MVIGGMQRTRRLLKGIKGAAVTISFDPTTPQALEFRRHRPGDPTYTSKVTLMVARARFIHWTNQCLVDISK